MLIVWILNCVMAVVFVPLAMRRGNILPMFALVMTAGIVVAGVATTVILAVMRIPFAPTAINVIYVMLAIVTIVMRIVGVVQTAAVPIRFVKVAETASIAQMMAVVIVL